MAVNENTGARFPGGNSTANHGRPIDVRMTLTQSGKRRISLWQILADGLVIWIGLIVCTATNLLCSAVLPNLTHAPVCRRTISLISVTVQMDLHLVKKQKRFSRLRRFAKNCFWRTRMSGKSRCGKRGTSGYTQLVQRVAKDDSLCSMENPK